MKSLGQIHYEVTKIVCGKEIADIFTDPWNELSDAEKDLHERIAKEVAEEAVKRFVMKTCTIDGTGRI